MKDKNYWKEQCCGKKNYRRDRLVEEPYCGKEQKIVRNREIIHKTHGVKNTVGQTEHCGTEKNYGKSRTLR